MITYRNFKFGKVKAEELLKALYRLRYQIYVEELGFEKPQDHPKGYETDAYEPMSIHFAALNESDDVIGTLRLILHSEKGFPIEHAADLTFLGVKPKPYQIAEISRLAVSKMYRRRQKDGIFDVESYLKKSRGGMLRNNGTPPDLRQRPWPVIVLGLYQAMYHEAKRRGITHLYLITKKKLFVALQKCGFHFKQIGKPVEYHGIRIPYLGIVEEMEKKLKSDHPEMLKVLLSGLEKEYHPRL